MAISSFYGLQTSLRGLLAQQRSMDTTAHNISNASTIGYSRQEATLAASSAMQLVGGTQSGHAGHLGSGVDVQSYRRIRDTFLDLQYRGQATNLGERAGTAEALDRAELALSEPSTNGLNAQLAKFWNAWSDLSNSPNSSAARQALVSQASALTNAFDTVDSQLELVGTQAAEEYAALTGPGGEISAIAQEIAGLNDTIGRFITAGDQPNDLLDRRDVLLDKLSAFGQVSVREGSQAGSIEVSFGDAALPIVKDTAANWPQTLTDPGGRLGALKALAGPTGTLASFRADLGAAAKSLADAVNAVYATANGGTAGPFFTYDPASPAGSLTLAVTAAGVQTSATSAAGASDVARQIAALRGGASDGAYQAFVARVGTEVGAASRERANAEVLTGAVDDRRQSVSGVAMDEEMSNLIKFQRGYQASARAMSTMDEMLDVLINRTGRVGL